MKRQEYLCDECGLESHVYYNDLSYLLEVVNLIDADHKKRSPKCSTPVSRLRIINELVPLRKE